MEPFNKLIIAGGRDFTNTTWMEIELDKLHDAGLIDENLELTCGMAKGADITAYNLFTEYGYTVKEFKADWEDMSSPCLVGIQQYGNNKKYNKLAGMKRNHEMGDYADVLLAFWDGKSKGTEDMIKYMKKLNKPVIVINY